MEATYQASAALTTQIQNGAPFDLFLSADMAYPKRLISDGLADARGSARLFHADQLCKRQPGPVGTEGFNLAAAIAGSAAKSWAAAAAIANPERAPYGRAAVAALNSLKLYDALRARLVTAENIAQAAQFVDSGNADAGLISLTSALTPHLSLSGSYFVIPRDLYPPIQQGAVIVSKTTKRLKLTSFLTICSPRRFRLNWPRQA